MDKHAPDVHWQLLQSIDFFVNMRYTTMRGFLPEMMPAFSGTDNRKIQIGIPICVLLFQQNDGSLTCIGRFAARGEEGGIFVTESKIKP